MKRFFLILCILCFPIFLFGQWVDLGGSTWAATTTQVRWEIKEIQNDVHDRTVSAIRIMISSQTIFMIDELGHIWVRSSTNSLTGIYQGGNTAMVRDGSTDNNATSESGLVVQSNLHGYNQNNWQRLIIEATNYHNLRVALYENGRILSINDFDSDDQAEGRDGIVVYSNLFGWNIDDDKWDRLRVNPMKYLYVVSSSESWVRVLESSGVILNFPTDYPDAAAASSLSSIDTNLEHCDTHDVVITSGTVKEFQVSNATGTVLNVGTGAVTTWTFPAGAVEITLEADKTNTDITRWRYWNENVKTAGNKLNPGDVWILNKYSGTTLYFQTEAGTQDIITQVLYE